MGPSEISPGSAQKLKQEVLDTGLCTSCVACTGYCPYIKTFGDRVAVIHDCKLTDGACYRVCPRVFTRYDDLRQAVFGPAAGNEPVLGTHSAIFVVRPLAALADYHARVEFNRLNAGYVPSFSPARKVVTGIFAAKKPGDRLSEAEAKVVLQAYGIPTTREALAVNTNDAAEMATEIGFPVALKIDSPDIPHKTEAGGVLLNLATAEDVIRGYDQITSAARRYKPDARINGVLVQEMLQKGTEVIAGIGRDPAFGPTILFGLGGIFVEALEDVSLRLAPLHEGDAREMVREIRGHKILAGMRGQGPVDEEAIADVLLRLSQLALDFPAIAELDINPLFVYEKNRGAVAADALIQLK